MYAVSICLHFRYILSSIHLLSIDMYLFRPRSIFVFQEESLDHLSPLGGQPFPMPVAQWVYSQSSLFG
jgi:hypothetical protein